jgi:hypothetical protein
LHLRQSVVEQHHGGIELCYRLNRLLPIARLSDRPALVLEQFRAERPNQL